MEFVTNGFSFNIFRAFSTHYTCDILEKVLIFVLNLAWSEL